MEPAVSLRVRVTPRGERDAIIGFRTKNQTLLVRVAAPPVDGAANKAVLKLIATVFGVKKAHVTLEGGNHTREKHFSLSGIDAAERERILVTLPALP